jgi:hypothetical protein
MSRAALEEIREEVKALRLVKALPLEEQQLKEVLNDEIWAGVVGLLFAFGLIYFLEKINAVAPDESQRLHRLLDQAVLDSGLVSKSDLVRGVRGKYAYLPTSSEAFAAQKQEEIRLEERK